MIKKRKLLIFYDWFYPGFRAGGPIQSLMNLTAALTTDFEIFIVTSAYDLNADIPYQGVTVNAWNYVELPGGNIPVKVFYALKKTLHTAQLRTMIREVEPYIIYLNGIFSYHFFLLPLLVLKEAKQGTKVIICPRGMLKKGALSGKGLKKKIYIKYLKLAGLLTNVYWHATTAEEQDDINKYFPADKGIFPDNRGIGVAANIPRKPLETIGHIHKQAGQLRLVYLSLINQHKNLLLLLEIIKQIKTGVVLDIYGPVVDELYWGNCLKKINELGDRVRYMGTTEPALVQGVISKYHGLILLTKGENFGHAIYESLSVGRPVITSTFTPWQNLCNCKAGANVDLEKDDSIMNAINSFLEMDQDEYSLFCAGAHRMAGGYYSAIDAQKRYKSIFA